jgi:dehydrogenase/reductase SDR family protein 7B
MTRIDGGGMTDLANKVVWITGASSGIGEALATSAARQGAKLILSSRREAELQRVRSLCLDPAKVAVLPLDLTSFDAEAAATQAATFFGPIDILVNNAGISQRSQATETTMAVYRQIFELDFFATVALAKALVPSMTARKSGHIVVISSVAGKFGAPLRTGYSGAKHALHGFFESLRGEVWRDGVKITLVCPGYIRTNISFKAITGDGREHGKLDSGQENGMAPERCAEVIWNGVAKDREEILVGREALLVHFKRHAPALFSAVLKRAVK